MDLPSGIATTCSVALSLFDENLSTAARIKQLSEDPSFAKLARDWDAKGKVGFAAALLMESPPMKKLLEDFDTFLEVARIFITESITPPNPLVDAALVLIKQVAPEQGELHAGAAKLLRVAMAARFCVEVDGLGAFNRAKDLDQAAQAALFKPTKEFLAGLHKQGLAPRWLAEWKEYLNQLKTERAEKAAAEAAAADEEGKKNRKQLKLKRKVKQTMLVEGNRAMRPMCHRRRWASRGQQLPQVIRRRLRQLQQGLHSKWATLSLD